MKKTAVILFNLGGPDSAAAIRPFLYNFFTDPNIIRLPRPLRNFIAWNIARKRTRKEAGISYGLLGGKSPLLANSEAQAAALEKNLNENGVDGFKVFICMRYWHPMAPDVARAVKEWGPDEIILLPLYPQFSTTTTRSSFGAWKKAAAQIQLNAPTSGICCYPFDENFIQTSAQNIRAVYDQALAEGHAAPRVLFSAHGLPESIVKDGDPYQWQCEEGARKIAQQLGIRNLDWSICYQSRVGPMKWIGPSTEDALEKAAHDRKAVIIYPHAFTQEHVETLVEIEIEYREKAHELGVPGFYRVPTVGANALFIDGLAALVQDSAGVHTVSAEGNKRLCPPAFKRCCMEA